MIPAMHLVFARHGESEANLRRTIANRADGPGLTAAGREQVARLAAALGDVPIGRVVASPLRRAVESAELLGSALGVEVDVSEALREFDCGIHEGRSDAAAWAAHAAIQVAWLDPARADDRIEGGESLTDLRARFRPFVDGLAATTDEAGGVVCVGHGGLFRWVLPAVVVDATGVPIEPPTLGYGEALAAVLTDAGLRSLGRRPTH